MTVTSGTPDSDTGRIAMTKAQWPFRPSKLKYTDLGLLINYKFV